MLQLLRQDVMKQRGQTTILSNLEEIMQRHTHFFFTLALNRLSNLWLFVNDAYIARI